MDDETVLQVDDVGKRYIKYDDTPLLTTALVRLPSRSRRSDLWAVRGVDLTVKRGEVIGIVGRNGSGKSTLLQMISGITAPTEGRIRVRGRVAPLISVGVGFHPELSGRDNLYVNGAILGLSHAEVDRRFDDVVEFAEMGSFIDTPVKFYSSGMAVRLGFSMAIQATPDVLVVDEVLAVGDLAFQLKCYDRMSQIRDEGTTILIVSHNLNAIRTLSDRVVVLHKGEKRFDGDPAKGISTFHELIQEMRELGDADMTSQGRAGYVPNVLKLESVDLLSAARRKTHHINSGDHVSVRYRVRALQDVENPFVRLGIYGTNGLPVYVETNYEEPFEPLKAGQSAVYEVAWESRLNGGSYTMRGMVGNRTGPAGVVLATTRPIDFYVTGRTGVLGVVDFGAQFVAQASRKKTQSDGKGRTRGRSTGAAAGRAEGSRSKHRR